MKVVNHILIGNDGKLVKYMPTPNKGGIIVPRFLIIHYDASPNSTGAISWMISPKSGVSAHLHIDRAGNVVQLAPLNVKCWHAGESSWQGIIGLNSHSIGIELQNTGKQEYTEVQLKAAEEASSAMVDYYSLEDILGHSDIAPGRKVDPGKQFPMASFKLASGIGVQGKVLTKKTTADLNIRSGAGTSSSIISVLPKGTDVNVLSEDGDWVNVFVCGSKIKGFVSKKYLK